MNKTILISLDGLASYYIKDNFVCMPNLESIINHGSSSLNLETVYPSVTWTIHASVLTGLYPKDHGIIGNWAYDKKNGEIISFFGENYKDKQEILSCKTIYDIAKKSGMSTAAVCWPLTRGAENIDFCIPEFYEQSLFEKYSTGIFWNELKRKGFPVEKYGIWSKDHNQGYMQDNLTVEIGRYLLEEKEIDFMMLHFLLADSFQHDYGTKTMEIKWALEYLDNLLGKIITVLNQKNLREKTNLVIFSDHGFSDISQYFLPNMLFKKMGWYQKPKSKNNQVIAVSSGGCGMVYINNTVIAADVYAVLKHSGFVEKIFLPDEFYSLGLPISEDNPFMADIIFEAKKGIGIDVAETNGEWLIPSKHKAMHGYLPAKKELKCIFAACGPDFSDKKEYSNLHITQIYDLVLGKQSKQA